MGTVHKCRHLDPIKIDRSRFQNWESVTPSCRASALCWAAGTGWLSEASGCQKRSAGNWVKSEEASGEQQCHHEEENEGSHVAKSAREEIWFVNQNKPLRRFAPFTDLVSLFSLATHERNVAVDTQQTTIWLCRNFKGSH